MARGILLEAGTNEMEILVFRLAETAFGINVAKVREIIQRPKSIPIPYSHPSVEGTFKLRDNVLTLVNLGRHFEMCGEEIERGEGLVIIVEFNQIRCGVLVDGVEMIYRVSWENIEPPSDVLVDMKAPITGSAQIKDRIILLADFETVIGNILDVPAARPVDVAEQESVSPKDIRVVFADDSITIRETMVSILTKHGYENVVAFDNGLEVWNYLQQHMKDDGGACDIVLTDIEMPKMDGLHLTSRIKTQPLLQDIPVVIFSSMINAENRRKGEQVGADAQLSKPDSGTVLTTIEEMMKKRGNER